MVAAADFKTPQNLLGPAIGPQTGSTRWIADYSIDLHAEPDEVADDWRRLDVECGATVYQSLRWNTAYLKTIGGARDIRPLIVTCRVKDGRCDALLALALRWIGPFRVLYWLGEDVSAYGGGLFSAPLRARLAENGFDGFWQAIIAALPAFDIALLKNNPASWQGVASPLLDLPCQRAANTGFTVNLDGDFEQLYRRKRSAHTRTRERRKDKRLVALPGFTFERVTDPGQLSMMLAIMARQKNKDLARFGVKGPFTPEVVAFFKDFARPAGTRSSPLMLYALSADGEVLATTIGALHNAVFYGISMSLTEGAHRKWSPGSYALRGAIRDCIASGVDILDFGPGNAAYKTAWHDSEIELFHIIAPRTVWGWPAAIVARAYVALKRRIKNSQSLWTLFTMLRRWRSRFQYLG